MSSIVSRNHALTHVELTTIYSHVEDIISTMDNKTLVELTSGSEHDISNILNILFEEATQVIHYNRSTKLTSAGFGYLDKFSSHVDDSLRKYSLNYFIATMMPDFELNWHHIEWGNLVQKYNKLAVIAARDHGKCMDPLTKILMFDGSEKYIKDIIVGDKVMGPDSKSRLVLFTHSGEDEMFEIKQSKGDNYIVNSKHILTLIYNNRYTNKKSIIDKEISELRNSKLSYLRGFKVEVEYKQKDLKLNPYFIGLWLGDGSKHESSVTSIDNEIIEYLYKLSKEYDLIISKRGCNYLLGGKRGKKNPIKKLLNEYNLLNNKHIPNDYLINSKENRLQLLAGLIDSDGSLVQNSYYTISTNNKSFSLQIKKLCNSLGFYTRVYEKKQFIKQINKEYISYNINISGNLYKIPTKILRKKVLRINKSSNKDVNTIDGINIGRISNIKIKSIGIGKYCGFSCDGDNRFLLSDGTVTHNSYYFSKAYPLWKLYRYERATAYKVVPKEYQQSKLGILITNEFGLAKHLLSIIKDEIEENELLRNALFPGKDSGKWAETEIICKNGAQLVAKSFGSKMRGFHPGYIILDDFMNDSVLYSEEQRQKYISSFYSVIMNMLIPGGQAINVGTPYSTVDLFAELKKQNSWKVFEYPAVFPDGSLLWANRHSIQSILEKKEQGTLIFSRENLCRPISSESTIFPWSLLQKSFNESFTLVNNRWNHPKRFKRIAMGCDFAMSGAVAADYSVFTVMGIDENDKYWVLNQYRHKGKSYSEQLALIKTIHNNFQCDVIMMETNGFQTIFAQEARNSDLPVIDHTTTGKNKKDLREGLPGMAILFEQEKIVLPTGDLYSKNVIDTLCIELSSVTFTDKGRLEAISGHDDCAMSIWIARLGCDYVNSSFNFGFI